MSETEVTLVWRPEMGFGERLRLVRLQYGRRIGRRLSQKEMAALLCVTETSYTQWEAGNSRPADIVGTAKRVHAVTAVDTAWLLGLDGPDGDPRDAAAQGVPHPSTKWYSLRQRFELLQAA